VLLNLVRPDGSIWRRTSPGLSKDRSGFVKRSVSAMTWSNLVDPAGQPVTRVRTDQDQVFFFQMWVLKPISIYTLCSQEKKYVFSICDLKLISIYTLCSQEKNYFFSMWDLKSISIYTLCSQEKSYVFSMWNKKFFWFKYFSLKA